VRKTLIVLLVLLVVPITLSTVKYLSGDRPVDWQTADRSSTGLLPSPGEHREALVRVYAARTVGWRGIFAVHSLTIGWGEGIEINVLGAVFGVDLRRPAVKLPGLVAWGSVVEGL
jgi:hypothetical protein